MIGFGWVGDCARDVLVRFLGTPVVMRFLELGLRVGLNGIWGCEVGCEFRFG